MNVVAIYHAFAFNKLLLSQLEQICEPLKNTQIFINWLKIDLSWLHINKKMDLRHFASILILDLGSLLKFSRF